jgi:hypothetical protein
MPALGAGIHAFVAIEEKAWIPVPSTGMTIQLGAKTALSNHSIVS